jgi:hypothetical protein
MLLNCTCQSFPYLTYVDLVQQLGSHGSSWDIDPCLFCRVLLQPLLLLQKSSCEHMQ